MSWILYKTGIYNLKEDSKIALNFTDWNENRFDFLYIRDVKDGITTRKISFIDGMNRVHSWNYYSNCEEFEDFLKLSYKTQHFIVSVEANDNMIVVAYWKEV